MNENIQTNSCVTVLTCGGTIDKDYSIDKGSYYFTFGEPAIKKILDGIIIRINDRVEIIELMQKDSLDMNEEDREIIKKTLAKVNNDKILITHGTDTMIDTGKTLKELAKDKVIVLVGSSIPENFRNTDAHLNIGFALGALKTLSNQKNYGVYIAMNGDCFEIDNVMKRDDGIFTRIN